MFQNLVILVFCLVGTFMVPNEAIEVSWEELSKVRFVSVYNEEYEMDYQQPIFDPAVEQLSGQQIVITGFLLPMDFDGDYFILSKNPYASCFFCSKDGSAGPETVIELRLKQKYTWFRMDDIVTIKGTLRLNDSDINQLYYILTDAEVTNR